MPHAAAHCHWHDLQPRPLTTVRGRAFLYTEAARAAPTPKSARRRRCSAPHSACGRVRETSESARCVPRTRSAPPVTLSPVIYSSQGFRGGAKDYVTGDTTFTVRSGNDNRLKIAENLPKPIGKGTQIQKKRKSTNYRR